MTADRAALYRTQPMLMLLDSYFLDAIGHLDAELAATLAKQAPKFAETLGGGPTWQEVVEHALHLDPATRGAVAAAWAESDGDPHDFAYACSDDLTGPREGDGDAEGAPPLETVEIDVDGVGVRAVVVGPLRGALQGVLDGFAAHREHWRDGYTQNWGGWGTFSLRTGPEEAAGFELVAPDYFNDPDTPTTDLTSAIMATAGISSVVAAAQLDPVATAYTDTVICVRGWEQEALLTVSRSAVPADGDAGIFVAPFHHDRDENNPWTDEHLEARAAWDVFRHRPAVARAFGLPVGVTAIVEREAIRMVVRDSDREALAEGPL